MLLQAHVYNFTKNRAPLQMLLCELGEFLQNNFLYNTFLSSLQRLMVLKLFDYEEKMLRLI